MKTLPKPSNPIPLLSPEEADQFALLLLAGMPALIVVKCFFPPSTSEGLLKAAAQEMPKQPTVQAALVRLTGGTPWQRLRPEERLELALKKHYAEMAYFLWTQNYQEAQGADKAKADTCRAALEAKLAGTAGKGNALERLYEELVQKQRMAMLPKVGKA